MQQGQKNPFQSRRSDICLSSLNFDYHPSSVADFNKANLRLQQHQSVKFKTKKFEFVEYTQ